MDGDDQRGRARRVNETRERIVTTAERLFAEHGLANVSNRQISEAAGQGNNTAVSYHFGSRHELIRAIMRRHTEPVEEARRQRLDDIRGSPHVRDWVGCLVYPATEHLAELGAPSWWARFGAQILTDPTLRDTAATESLSTPAIRQVLDGLTRCEPGLPLGVHLERRFMASRLIVNSCAEREVRLAEGITTFRDSWYGTAVGLVDAITGLWTAPVTHTDPAEASSYPSSAQSHGGDRA